MICSGGETCDRGRKTLSLHLSLSLYVPLQRHLRMLGGNLHAAAAVMMDMSRAVLATAIGLDDNPRALAAATTATLRLDGEACG